VYKRGDPRTERLMQLAHELGIAGHYVRIAAAYRQALAEELGKASLPLNIDGCIAALLCELGFVPEVGNLFFALSRTAGLMAHIQEERCRERPLRDILWDKVEYDGPAPRALDACTK
jgi:citrate synthase